MGCSKSPKLTLRLVSESDVAASWLWDVLGCEMGTVAPTSLGALQDETNNPGESPGASGVGEQGGRLDQARLVSPAPGVGFSRGPQKQ